MGTAIRKGDRAVDRDKMFKRLIKYILNSDSTDGLLKSLNSDKGVKKIKKGFLSKSSTITEEFLKVQKAVPSMRLKEGERRNYICKDKSHNCTVMRIGKDYLIEYFYPFRSKDLDIIEVVSKNLLLPELNKNTPLILAAGDGKITDYRLLRHREGNSRLRMGKICTELGGGGHDHRAGITRSEKTMEEIRQKLLECY